MALACALVCAGAANAAHAETVSWREDMVCGADADRPDRQPGLAQKYVLTPNGTIAYYRFGQGSPIVLVTGYRAKLSEWNAYFLRELASRHEVILLDNRGVGASVSRAGGYHMADLADDTETLIETLKLRDVTLLGWSMGGMVAQSLLFNGPSQVRRAVLLSTEPPGHRGVPVPDDVMAVLSGKHGGFKSVMSVLFPAPALQQAQHCFVSDMFKPADYHARRIGAEVTRAQDGLLREWEGDLRAYRNLHEVNVPVLVVSGLDDQVLAPRNGAILAAALPASVQVDVTGAGHAMMYQYPRELAQQISRFIAQTGKQ